MASGADDSGVPGSGDSDQAVEANGASRWADWTLNRVLVVAGFVFAVFAPPFLFRTDPFFFGPPPLPLLPGSASTPPLPLSSRPRASLLGQVADSVVSLSP